jgi:hypothetical protein
MLVMPIQKYSLHLGPFLLRKEEVHVITDVLSDIRGVVRHCDVFNIFTGKYVSDTSVRQNSHARS